MEAKHRFESRPPSERDQRACAPDVEASQVRRVRGPYSKEDAPERVVDGPIGRRAALAERAAARVMPIEYGGEEERGQEDDQHGAHRQRPMQFQCDGLPSPGYSSSHENCIATIFETHKTE
jgi:hypothetical protein